jgi:hypothetical protein
MADDPTKHAIDTVAHRMIARLISDGHWGMADYQDIPDLHMTRVTKRVREIRAYLDPGEDAYEAAYEHLTEGAAP